MSTSIDNRVVQMEFDNAQFEQGVSQSLQTLTRLDAALNDLENAGGFKGLSQSISSIGDDFEETFSFRGVAALTTFQHIAESVINTVVGLFNKVKSNYLPIDMLDQAISGGSRRAQNIENAKFRLEGLGVAWDDVAKDIDHAVNNTAYGLDAAAKAASIMVAQGMEYGSDLEAGLISPLGKALRGISGVAAMTNSTYDDIADIFEKIGSRNKVQAREANMLTSRALPLYATLTKYFNGVIDGSIEASDSVTSSIMEITGGMHVIQDDFTEFSKDGVINAEIFFEAMDTMFGEHATEANKTYAGSLDNVKAALSRLGAAYMQGHMDNMIEVFNALRLAINRVKTALEPSIKSFVEFEHVATHAVAEFLNGFDDFGASAFGKLLAIVRGAAAHIKNAFTNVFPNLNKGTFADFLHGINEFAKGLTIRPSVWNNFQKGVEGILSVVKLLGQGIGVVLHILSPWLQVVNVFGNAVMRLFGSAGEKVKAFTDAIGNNKGVSTFVDQLYKLSSILASGVSIAINVLATAFENLGTVLKIFGTVAFVSALVAISKIKEFVDGIIYAFTTIKMYISMVATHIKDAFGKNGFAGAFDALKADLKHIPTWFKTAFDPLTNLLKPIVSVAIGLFAALVLAIKNKITALGNTIYNALPKPFKTAVDKIQEFANQLKTTFTDLIANVKSFFSTVKTAFDTNGFAGVFDLVISYLKTIPGLVLAAFMPFLGPIANGITTFIDSAKTSFQGLISTLANSQFGQAINTACLRIRESIDQTIEDIKSKFNEFAASIENNPVILSFRNLFQKLKAIFEDFFKGLTFENLDTKLSQLFERLGKTFANFGRNIKAALKLGSFSDLFDSVVNFVTSSGAAKLAQAFFTAAKDAVVGLARGFMDGSVLGQIWSAITALVGSKEGGGIIGFFANLVGWHSPWTIMIAAGVAGLMGLAVGLRDSAGMQAIFASLGAVKDGIMTVLEPIITGIAQLGTRIKTKLSSILTLENIGKAFSTVWGGLTTVASVVSSLVTSFVDLISQKIGTLKDSVLGLFQTIGGVKIDPEKLSTPFKLLYNGLSKVFELVQGLFGFLSDAGNGKFGELVKNALGIGALIIIPQILLVALRTIDTVKLGILKFNAQFLGVLNSIKNAFSFIGGFAKAIQMNIQLGGIRKTIMSIAVLIGVIGTVVYALAKLNPSEFNRAEEVLAAISVFTLTLVGIIALIQNTSNSFVKVPGMKKNLQVGLNSFLETAAVLVGLGIAVYAIAKGFETLSQLKFDWSQAWGPISVIVTSIAALSFAVAMIGTYAPKLASGAVTLLAVAYAVNKIVDTYMDLITICVAMNAAGYKQELDEAFNTIIWLMMGIAGIAAAAGFSGVKGGIGLLAIMVSLILLKKVFETICDPIFSSNAIFFNAESIITALGLIAAIMATTRTAGKYAAQGGVAVFLVTGSIILIMNAFTKMAATMVNIRWQDVIKSLVAVSTVMGMVAILLYSTSFLPAKGALKSALVILALNSLILTVTLMLGLMTIAAKLAPGPFVTAGIVLSVLLGVLAGLVAVTSLTGKANPKVMIAFVASLVTIFAGLAVLSVIGDPFTIIVSLTGLVVVFGMLAQLAKASSKIDKGANVWGIVALTAALAMAAGSLYLLADKPWANILVAAISISGVMLAIAGVTKIIETIQPEAWIPMIGIAGAAVLIGLGLSQLAQYDWKGMLAAAGAMALTVAVLAGATALLGAGPIAAATGTGVLVLLGIAGAAAIFSVSMVGFAIAAQTFADAVTQIHESGMSLEEVHDVMNALASGMVSGFIDGLLEGVTHIGEALGPMGEAVIAFFTDVIAEARASWEGAIEVFGLIGSAIADRVSQAWNTIKTTVVTLATSAIEEAKASWDGAKEVLGMVWDSIKEKWTIGIENAWNTVVNFFAVTIPAKFEEWHTSFNEWGSKLIDGLKAGFEERIELLKSIPSIIKNAIFGSGENSLNNLEEEGKKRGNNFLSGLIQGIQDKGLLGTLGEGAKAAGQWVLNAFDPVVGNRSPWTTMIERGQNAIKGLAEGISDPTILSLLNAASEKLGKMAVEGASGSLEQGFDMLYNLAHGKIDGLLSLFDQANGILSSMPSGLGTKQDIDALVQTGKMEEAAKAAHEQALAQAKLEAEMRKAENAANDESSAVGDLGKSLKGAGGAAGSAAKSTEDAAEAAKKHADAVKHENEAIEKFTEIYGDAFKKMDETIDVPKLAKEAIEELAQTFGKSADEIGESEEDLEELFNSMYSTVKESVEGSISMFEEFKVEASGSVKDLIHNMNSNLEGVSSFGDKLARLAMRGFAPKLIEELQAAGPKAANQANQLLKATFSEMVEINNAYAQKEAVVSDTTAKIIAALAYAQKTQDQIAQLATNAAKDINYNDALKAHQEALTKFAKYGVDINKTLFGNVDLANRQILEWTEENIEKYHDVLSESFSESEVKDMIGSISTVLGAVKEFGDAKDPLPIAFSPLLQTDHGAELLSESTIDTYINSILDKAREECGEFSNEDLLRLDAEGMEIDGVKICNIIADIGQSAYETSEAMHYLGVDGEIMMTYDELKAAASVALAEVAARIDQIKVTSEELRSVVKETVSSQIDLFSKFEKKDNMSSQTILENMKSQIDGFRNWGANLAIISQRAAEANFSENGEFLKMLAAMGPKSADLIGGIANMTQAEFDQMSQYWGQSLVLPDEIAALVGDSYLNTGLNAANSFVNSINQALGLGQTDAATGAMAVANGVADGYLTTMEGRAGEVTDTTVEAMGTNPIAGTKRENGIASPSTVYKDIGSNVVLGYIMGINSEAGSALQTMIAFSNDLIDGTKSILNFAAGQDIGSNLMAGITAGIYGGIDAAVSAAVTAATAVNNAIREVGKIESPSKVWHQFGLYFDQGLALGLEDGTDDAVKSTIGVAQRINDAINGSLATELDGSLQPVITPVLDLTDVQNGLANMNGMMNNSTVYARGIAGSIGSVSLTNSALSNLANAINGMQNSQGTGNNTYNITINTQPGQNAKEIADMTLNKLNNQIRRRKAAFA